MPFFSILLLAVTIIMSCKPRHTSQLSEDDFGGTRNPYNFIEEFSDAIEHSGDITDFKQSKDGKLLFSIDSTGKFNVWQIEHNKNANTGKQMVTRKLIKSEEGISKDDQTPEEFKDNGLLKTMAIYETDDGEFLIPVGGRSGRVWNIWYSKEWNHIVRDPLPGSLDAQINGISISRDGKLIVASGINGYMHYWYSEKNFVKNHVTVKNLVRPKGRPDPLRPADESLPLETKGITVLDDYTVVVSRNHNVELWNLRAGSFIHPYKVSDTYITAQTQGNNDPRLPENERVATIASTALTDNEDCGCGRISLVAVGYNDGRLAVFDKKSCPKQIPLDNFTFREVDDLGCETEKFAKNISAVIKGRENKFEQRQYELDKLLTIDKPHLKPLNAIQCHRSQTRNFTLDVGPPVDSQARKIMEDFLNNPEANKPIRVALNSNVKFRRITNRSINSLKFLSGGSYLLAGGIGIPVGSLKKSIKNGGSIRLYNLNAKETDSGQSQFRLDEIRRLYIENGDAGITTVGGFHDKENPEVYFVFGNRPNIQVWRLPEMDSRYRVASTENEPTTSVMFTPDSQYVVSGHPDGNLKLWKVKDKTNFGPDILEFKTSLRLQTQEEKDNIAWRIKYDNSQYEWRKKGLAEPDDIAENLKFGAINDLQVWWPEFKGFQKKPGTLLIAGASCNNNFFVAELNTKDATFKLRRSLEFAQLEPHTSGDKTLMHNLKIKHHGAYDCPKSDYMIQPKVLPANNALTTLMRLGTSGKNADEYLTVWKASEILNNGSSKLLPAPKLLIPFTNEYPTEGFKNLKTLLADIDSEIANHNLAPERWVMRPNWRDSSRVRTYIANTNRDSNGERTTLTDYDDGFSQTGNELKNYIEKKWFKYRLETSMGHSTFKSEILTNSKNYTNEQTLSSGITTYALSHRGSKVITSGKYGRMSIILTNNPRQKFVYPLQIGDVKPETGAFDTLAVRDDYLVVGGNESGLYVMFVGEMLTEKGYSFSDSEMSEWDW